MKTLPLDLEKHETLDSTVIEALNLFGIIDVLVNNGGFKEKLAVCTKRYCPKILAKMIRKLAVT